MPTSTQRRNAERRRLQRQADRRTSREGRRRRALIVVTAVNVLVLVAAVVGLLIATSGDDRPSAAGAPTSPPPASSGPATATTSAAAYPCTWRKAGRPARAVRPPATTHPPRSGKARASVETSEGRMVFMLDRASAPCAVASFLSLAGQRYYDGTSCHRLTTGPTLYVLQCGDPTGTGNGSPGYTFNDELTGKEIYTQGVLAMANSGPDTNGSQFFIVYQDSQLPPNYTIFGRVSEGLGVVRKVGVAGSIPNGDGTPRLPLRLIEVTEAI